MRAVEHDHGLQLPFLALPFEVQLRLRVVDRLLRRLNRQLALMVSPGALELPTSTNGQF